MKRINLYMMTLLLIFIAGSCTKDFFELERPPQNPWITLEEFDRAPVGLYWSLFNGAEWSNPWVNLTLAKVSSGDDVNWVNNPEWGYWRKTKEYNKYTDVGFLQVYRTIGGANDAISFVEKHNGNPYPDESDENIKNNLNRIVGECHFIRAYAYYMLQTTFGHAYVPGVANDTPDIPLRITYPTSVEDAKNPKIGTTKEVYDLIVSDLIKAKESLPEKYDAATMHPSYQVRATKYAASAMLMRAYFQMGDYDNADKEASFLINDNKGEFDLSEDPIAAWSKSDLSRGREVIFYIPAYDDLSQAPMHLTVLNFNAADWGPCGWNENRMGESTVKRLGWMNNPANDTTISVVARRDKRFTQLFGVRYPVSKAAEVQATDERSEISETTTIWPNKYYRGEKGFHTNVPIIRLAEVYLTRSILRFKAGDKTGAAKDLDMVRERAWDTAVGGPFVPSLGSITEQMINDERLIEMCGENDRIDYLRALKEAIPKGERGAGTDPYTSEDFVWAIPSRELLYNESLKK